MDSDWSVFAKDNKNIPSRGEEGFNSVLMNK